MTDTLDFSQLAKTAKGKRGKGLSSPPKPTTKKAAIPKEHTPAVPAAPPKRTYRVSTYLFEDKGELLEAVQLKLRKQTGRKVKQAEVIEKALELLEKTL